MTKKCSPTPGQRKRAPHLILLWPGSQGEKRFISSFPPSCLSTLNSVLQYNMEPQPSSKGPPSLIWLKSFLSPLKKAYSEIELISGCMLLNFFSSTLPALSFNTPPTHIWDGGFTNEETGKHFISESSKALFLLLDTPSSRNYIQVADNSTMLLTVCQ